MADCTEEQRPVFSLPLDSRWATEEDYVRSLLALATNSNLFQNLCGGVHVLDFLTREPDLYTTVLPFEWRNWFDLVEVDEVLELLLRADLDMLKSNDTFMTQTKQTVMSPPQSLLEYVDTIRKHCLQRQFDSASAEAQPMPRHIAVGMKPKKVHEVANFAACVDKLSARVSEKLGQPVSLVDFGSGQNYLGRCLASPPYNRHVIAIERKHHNVQGARGMDVHAKLTRKEKIMRNKKAYKQMLGMSGGLPTPPNEAGVENIVPDIVLDPLADEEVPEEEQDKGSMTYIEHDIQDGHLETILYPEEVTCEPDKPPRNKVMTISLHSCGNLSHHGIRSLILNPSVSAIAIIGCCYNLLTERLGPASYKLPHLRSNHPRLEATSSAFDPHGFPMSQTLATYKHTNSNEVGVRLNITARMMGVQAPYNWGAEDSEAFFRRHYYRALLQRILLDRGVVQQRDTNSTDTTDGNSLSGKDTLGPPLIVGSLRKACFTSFGAYVRGALAKLTAEDSNSNTKIEEANSLKAKTADLTDEVIAQYEAEWSGAKKKLSVIWSLMAFSAGVVESLIVVDRWLYLREQDCVAECWVETVFDYKYSPRNLAVVGIKKLDGDRGNEKDINPGTKGEGWGGSNGKWLGFAV